MRTHNVRLDQVTEITEMARQFRRLCAQAGLDAAALTSLASRCGTGSLTPDDNIALDAFSDAMLVVFKEHSAH